jgi:AraC-like DNA-binding protein
VQARKPKRLRFNSIPTAGGGIARAACARALKSGLDVKPLLKRCDLTVTQVNNPDIRLSVKSQVGFLNLVADGLDDEFLGMALAQNMDAREVGFLYYVLASSETLAEGLKRIARYSTIQNEGVRITYRELNGIVITFEYVGVARRTDRHQIEFFVSMLLKICRQTTRRNLSPSSIRLVHRRTGLPNSYRSYFGCDVAFGSKLDQIIFPASTGAMPLLNADPFLSSLLVKYCEEAAGTRRRAAESWQIRLENVIVPLLPHRQSGMAEVARRLGVSQQTLTRRLASEGCTFSGVLDKLRMDLAERYLADPSLQISQIAWLLGYREASALNHALKRWTGKTPKQMRSALCSD